MIIYMYLAILIVISIITGIIVTIMERKGFYPKIVKPEKKKKEETVVAEKSDVFVVPDVSAQEEDSFASEPIITNAVTVFNMEPVEKYIEPVVVADDYDIPVLISSYTVDLSGVIDHIQKIDIEDEKIELIKEDASMSQSEGLV